MAKKKVCKNCKLIVEGNECVNCHGQSFSTNFQGRLFVNDVQRSLVAEKINIKVKGEYAIKVR